MCEQVSAAYNSMTTVSAQTNQQDRQSGLKMTATTVANGREGESSVANKVMTSPVAAPRFGERRPPRRRSKKLRNNQMEAANGPKVGLQRIGSMVERLLLWSVRRTFNFSQMVSIAKIICLANLIILSIECDDGVPQAHQPEVYSNQNHQSGQHQVELQDLIKQQRDPRGIYNLDELLGTQDSSSSLSYNLINPTNEEMALANQQQAEDGGGVSPETLPQQQQQQQHAVREQRDNDQAEPEQLETAQTKAQGSTAPKTSESSEKTADAAAQPSSGGGAASPTPSTSSGASAASSSLTDHLSAVNNLLHQAGQIGLSAAQQNVALSEAIISSVTSSLVGNNRKQNAQAAAAAQPQQVTGPLVGQSIDGNIEYNQNSNTIDGFINFPTNFSGIKPSLSGAMKPLLLAAIKTVPIKFGSVGWKLLKLLAWKKIYKAHHPKSSEIVIEQEMKPGGHGGGLEMDKGGKLGSKISDHFESKFKTSKMGSSYGSGGGGSSDDWTSLMRSPGMGADVFSNSWAHGDPHAASASMIYQRHMLPPGAANPLLAGGANHQQAAAAAAAAAATAAAIQSHWQQQQQQHQVMADETSEHSRTNQTGAANQSTSGQAGALRRKKSTFGGSNWFAANPAHTYAAAAAAANAAAAMASQHQQQQQQRLAGIMRAYELGGQYSDQMSGLGGSSSPGSGMQHALATGLVYQSLFDNAAAMAVQNTVRLPGADLPSSRHNPLANAEFLDQSDSLSGSSFDSFSSSGVDSGHDSNPFTLMQRHDLETNFEPGAQRALAHKLAPDSTQTLNVNSFGALPMQLGPRRSAGSHLDTMPDFDESPTGSHSAGSPFNESSNFLSHRFMNNPQSVRWN